MPGRGEHQRGAERRALLGGQVRGIARGDLVREARLAVRHLVMGLGVDHPVERVAVVVMGERVGDRRHVPRLVARGDQHLADRMHELRVPLRAKSRTAILGPGGDLGAVTQVLGDRDAPRETLGDLSIDPQQEAPALRESVAVVALVAAHAADVERHVEPQSVEVVLLQPVERVVADELADLERQRSVQGDDELSVEHEAAQRKRSKVRDHFRKKPRQRLPGLRLDLDLVSCPEREAAEPVPLRFELPTGAFRQFRRSLGFHRLERQRDAEQIQVCAPLRWGAHFSQTPRLMKL